MSEVKTIKETKEAIEALKLCVVAGKHIAKGGVSSVPAELIALAPKYQVLIDGVKGAEEIAAELKDLEKDEIIGLFVSVFEAVKEVEKA